jgi:hypothetical protein
VRIRALNIENDRIAGVVGGAVGCEVCTLQFGLTGFASGVDDIRLCLPHLAQEVPHSPSRNSDGDKKYDIADDFILRGFSA